MLLAGLLHSGHLEFYGLFHHAVGFQEQDGGHFGQPHVKLLIDHVYGDIVHKLQYRRLAPAGNHTGDGFAGVFQGVKAGQAHAADLGNGNHLEGGFHDQSQGSFGTAHKLFQLVAGGVHPGVGPQVDQGAVGQDNLHAQHRVAGSAVLDGPEPACIGANLTADGGDTARGGSRRPEEPMGFQGAVEIIVYHAGLHYHQGVIGADSLDAVHPLEIQHDPTVDGYRVSGAAGAGPAADYRNLVFVGVPDDALHLLNGVRFDHHVRHGVMHRGVPSVHIQIGRMGGDKLLAHNGLQLIHIYVHLLNPPKFRGK